jgi:hypothetical protein
VIVEDTIVSSGLQFEFDLFYEFCCDSWKIKYFEQGSNKNIFVSLDNISRCSHCFPVFFIINESKGKLKLEMS